MKKKEAPHLFQAEKFPSASRCSRSFVSFKYGAGFPDFVFEAAPGSKLPVPAEIPVKGYSLEGWFGENGRKWDFETDAAAGNFALSAKRSAIVYRIKHFLNGGENSPSNPDSYTIESPETPLKDPSRGEDAFASWHEDPLFSGAPVSVLDPQRAENVSLYARFVSKRKEAPPEAEAPPGPACPGIALTKDGADLSWEGGISSPVLISLFTKKGWAGNVFLPPESRTGSDFEEACRGSITLSKLADVENAAERALSGKEFGGAQAKARNPDGNSLLVEIALKGASLSIAREKGSWRVSS